MFLPSLNLHPQYSIGWAANFEVLHKPHTPIAILAIVLYFPLLDKCYPYVGTNREYRDQHDKAMTLWL